MGSRMITVWLLMMFVPNQAPQLVISAPMQERCLAAIAAGPERLLPPWSTASKRQPHGANLGLTEDRVDLEHLAGALLTEERWKAMPPDEAAIAWPAQGLPKTAIRSNR
jgi:hypothetical protein